MRCLFAGVLEDGTGRFLDDEMPFHCACNVRYGGNPFADAFTVDQWGRTGEEKELERVFDPWTGGTGDLYKKEKTPWSAGMNSLLEECTDRRGVARWCWREKTEPAAGRPWLPKGQNCAAYGAQIGQSMSYVTIHAGEILTLMAFRTDGFFGPYVFSNKVFLFFLGFNISALITFLYVTPISGALQLAPLTPLRLTIALFFAFCVLTLNEIVKIAYRNRMAAFVEEESEKAIINSRAGSPMIGDEEKKEKQGP